MSVARDRAIELRDLFKVESYASHSHLDRMLVHGGIEVVMLRELPGGLKDILAEPFGLVLRNVGREWELWLKGHLLAHRWLHVGNQLELPKTMVDGQERQADEFAGYVLWGEPSALFEGYALTVQGVARSARVPVSCVERWWRQVAGRYALEPQYVAARSWRWAR